MSKLHLERDAEFLIFFDRIHFHHEEMSTMMLDYLIDDNAIDIHRDDVRFIQDLILSRDAEYVLFFLTRFDRVKRNFFD